MIIEPNILLRMVFKKKIIKFENIRSTTVTSNSNSTGYRIAYRRYYVTLRLKDAEELKLIGSNKDETAREIAESMNAILR